MFEKFKRNIAANRLIEEELYEQALTELDSGQLRGGLWAKAQANSSGDEQKVRGLYLKYRVQAMKDETELAKGVAEKVQEVLLRQTSQKTTRKDNDNANSLHISNYRPLNEFSRHKGTPEDKLIKMIRDGFYQGRLFDEQWHVHKSEFSS